MTSNHALLLSIRPQFVKAIFAQTKNVELRRVRPRLNAGDLVIVYESEATKGIVGAFVVAGVTTGSPQYIWRKHNGGVGIAKADFDAYFFGVNVGYAIQIGSVWRPSTPILLETLRERRAGFRPPQSYHYLNLAEILNLGVGDALLIRNQQRKQPQDANGILASRVFVKAK